MAFTTEGGTGSGLFDYGDAGILEVAADEVLFASDLHAIHESLQAAPAYSHLAGVMEGGVCGAVGLNVIIPAGTRYFAWQEWYTADSYSQAVPDDDVTYIWGCSDGQVRTTDSTTPPASFDARTAALITKATAAAGVVTIDNTVQQKARFANSSTRQVTDGPLTLDYSGSGAVTITGTLTGGLQAVRKNSGGSEFTRRRLNLIEGTGITLTVADDAGNTETDITIAAGAGAGDPTDWPETAVTTTTYTILSTDGVITALNASAITLTLPAASGVPAGKIYFIKRLSTLSSVTINRAGSDTIDGGTSIVLTETYESIVLESDGTSAWRILARYLPSATAYETAAFIAGKPGTSEIVGYLVASRAFTLPASLTGSYAKANTAATAQTDIDIQKNGSSIGTIRFAAAGSTASFIFASPASFAAGDILKLVAPVSQDATLSDIGITLVGSLG